MLKELKRKNYEWVLKNVPNVNEISDLVGKNEHDELIESSLLFIILCRVFKKQLNVENKPSSRIIYIKQKYVYKVFMALGSLFLNGKKISRVTIADLPNNRPLIFSPNHGFTEDIMSSFKLSEQHGFAICGSLPMYFNTFNGIAQSIYGAIIVNRNNKYSRKTLIDKAVHVLKNGGNILLFPEGVWNKTANKLTIDFWPGIFWIAKQSNALIVPEIHLPVEKTIYCSRLPAFDVSVYDDSQVKEALNDLRTIMNTELYSLMEKYAHTTREEIIGECESMTEAGEKFFQERVNSVGKYYDYPMEVSADYRPKDVIREVDVWKPIANIQPTKENLLHYLYAKDRVAILEREDYQHRI